MEEDWDLWAVVRSCCTPPANASPATNHHAKDLVPVSVPPTSLAFEQKVNHHFDNTSYGGTKRNNGFEELNEVYKTFFAYKKTTHPNNHPKEPPQPQPQQPINPSTNSKSFASLLGGFNDHQQEPPPKSHSPPINPNNKTTHFISETLIPKPQCINPTIVLAPSTPIFGDSSSKSHPKEEEEEGKNKNPNPNRLDQCGCNHRKRSERKAVVLVEVEAGDLAEVDPWNWRKYGRKPIKASPYPRNYYKCSSEGINKYCQAKKYVEKSPSHPGKFMVSYSGEHHHSPPRHRNAQG